jgi:hypothetical protein
MKNYIAYFDKFGGAEKGPTVEFEANGDVDAHVKARRFATENVVVLKAVVDVDEAAGPLPLAA